MGSIDSSKKRGMGQCSGLFEPQTEPVAQLLWHEETVHAFEACAAEISDKLLTKVVGAVKELFHRDRLSVFQCLDNWLQGSHKTWKTSSHGKW